MSNNDYKTKTKVHIYKGTMFSSFEDKEQDSLPPSHLTRSMLSFDHVLHGDGNAMWSLLMPLIFIL